MKTNVITQDKRLKDILQLAHTVAQSKASVIIQGESGTGKELIAKMIHDNSTRAQKPWVAINCAAIPDNLLESELFGYEKGAFTGALNSKAGKFELAHGGTLLLDEISEMDIRLQAKLLRVLQQNEVDRIGGREPIKVDVRILATTNRNLSECVKQGTFREDLFFRLNVVHLTLPPLRERLGDVRLLSQFFMNNFCKTENRSLKSFSEEAFRKLESHRWSGNVRELENVIERVAITSSSSMIQAQDVVIYQDLASQNEIKEEVKAFAQGTVDDGSWAPGETLNDIEKKVILDALKYYHGNRTHTAKALGISIRTLRNKLSDYRKIGIHV